MPVSLVVGDVASFRKYVKYIGRAYQKRSVAMIQLCRLFLEISPGKPDQIDALRSLFETVEDALKSAVDAGKDRSDAADAAFATAEEELDWYAAWHHPKQQEVLGDVQNIIEDAAQKDNYIAKTHKRLSTRLGLNRSGSPPSSSLVKVHFQILRSPTDRREAPIVTCELGPDVKISELLWTFSRLPEDQRIGLKQNPHFYFSKDLSDQASVYDDQFKLEPLKDLRPEKDLVVMVLLDRAGQIFVDYQQFSKTYGNIWRPENTIILKDLQGTLEAADLISPRISGEVCIWQRGGGRPAEEDLSKWTEVLDRALDLPDVDWLIRSETAPDEAFDIEVTGGWERCSPAAIPDPPGLSEQDDPATITPPHEDILIPPEEPPSPVSLLNTSVPSVGTTSQETYHPSQDTSPPIVAVEILSEIAQGIAKECSSTVEDKDSLALDISPSLGSTPSQVEAVIHLPVNQASTHLELFTPSEESELAPASITSAAKRTAPMAAESICSQNEPVHAQTPLACSSSNPSTHIDSIVASSSDVLTPLKHSPSDDTTASHTPVQPPESTPNRTELAAGPTPDRISEPGRPQAEAIRAPNLLGRHSSGHPIPFIGDIVEPVSVMSTRSRTTTSDSTLSQAGAANVPTFPRPPILANSPPIVTYTPLTPAPASDTVPLRSKIDHPVVQSARSPVYIVPPTGNGPTSPSGVRAPDRIQPFAGRVRSGSRVETASQPLVVESPPAPAREPSVPVGKKQPPHANPSPLERIRAPVEAARSSNQNSSAPSKPRISSVVASGAPTFHKTLPPSERTHSQVETRPPVRHAHAHPPAGPRTSVGGQLRGVPVPDTKAMHSSSRSRIKSHPRKMVTPTGQRRSTVFSTEINVPSAVQPSGLPVEHSTSSLGPSYANSTQLHATLVGSHCHGTLPENRGGYQSYATRTGQPEVSVSISVSAPAASNGTGRMSFQDSMGQSRRSTVLAGQISAQLARPVEKHVLSTAPSRNSPVPVARQDKTGGALSHSCYAKSSNLVTIQEGQGALKGYSATRSTPSTISHAAGAKLNSPSLLPNKISRTPSVVNIKDSALHTRKSITLPEQTTSQLAVRLQPITNPFSSSSNFSNPVTMARPSNGFSVGPKVLPSPPVGGAATKSASPVWNSSARTPSRIKTKDLINRHKQQNANNDARPTSTTESASPSRAPTSALSQTATLAGKSSANRTDSGIELWDYDDRRRGPDASVNGHGSPCRDRGPSSPLPTSSPVGTRSTSNREDGTSSSLSSKKSRMSMLGSSSHVVSPTHSGNPMSTPEQVKNSLLNVTTGSSSTGSLASTAPGRREPFINRKPQPTSQSTSQGRATPQSGYSTPPRSSTPSSVSHTASTSTRATMVTPATSFTIPSRVPSPIAEVGSKSSWFRRNVIDPVKSKLGYGS